MTGPEHYRAAERLLAGAHYPRNLSTQDEHLTRDERIQLAQVHATLALVAGEREEIGGA